MTDLMAIVLAAGEGTRMKSAHPKVLHKVGGRPIAGHVLAAAREAGASTIAMITGPGHDAVRKAMAGIDPDVAFFEQTERKGTAHAASMARPVFAEAKGYVAVVYGDHPLLRGADFSRVTERLDAGLDAAILGFEPKDPTGYGRFITDGEKLLAIREHKDASESERAIGLCNACILAFRAEVFTALIDKVGSDNAQGEYYLTDLVELANAAGHKVGYAVAPEDNVMGVNDRAQLARAEAVFQQLRREDFMAAGVTLHDPASVYFSFDTKIAPDVEIEPNVVFGPGVEIERGAVIHAFSHIEGAHIGAGANVGPFARLRPGANLGEGAKVGNFVEVKNAGIGQGAKVSHLTYIGDADIGAGANIGAGTVTCNYDGYNKARTIIGEHAFIGSNSALVAPVEIGDGAYVASGSVITEPVPADALGIGRSRQINKPGYGKALNARFKAIKDNK
ncbi:bifunctional UDP-N-acetylglucosamine diphosphorylase/glucosamine-1-phosphate N-acetyltransferase GlmU [Pelagibacterium flavum]|uniref:Bifunctional protein GlmU n=1 Tax=Pelagibacterium flavum TaxID=2984530 RepID=A0ABY6IM11_9HYPH|nr:bifunctional UDP-N-acetylglucosamine diphosphorylase/glucosamine-1-phosphate N-acetyltransferase GlmU [Pelagibacterium sp. YIM 151497]MAN76937.1 bifunctional N-acetylglucosamine-1-phosphate uridyltransferase/glucosamine-1-phosphate acetyltransferase [Hyphomicrobiales bacterium]UYQ70527.1 bifunctional UDP-N-acetylglucosamine diphosphorylase/glucosamine-1-phosphate N-acetyltransferase GlmU [Pelagibacterium sp. YIM 151497]